MQRGFTIEGVHYRWEYVKCGRECKRCLHGPYWYAYSRARLRQHKRYIGKRLPDAVRAVAPDWAKRFDEERA